MPSYNKTGFILNKLKAFSLVEVLMTLLIMSLIIVALAPVITRKITLKSKDESVVFTYEGDIQADDDGLCYMSELDRYDADGQNRVSSTRCSEYTFTVPEGVNYINLTLVAGGGGGGGAGGSFLTENTLTYTNTGTVEASVNFDRIKDITIDFMSAKGGNSSAYNSSSACNTGIGSSNADICATKGGKSSSAIIDFKLSDIRNLGDGYLTPMEYPNSSDEELSISSDSDNSIRFRAGDLIEYFVSPPEDTDPQIRIGCTVGANSYNYDEADFNEKCKIPSNSVYPEQEGQIGQYLDKNQKLLSGIVLYGGDGGHINSKFKSYGSGAKGRDVKVMCRNGSYECSANKGSVKASVAGTNTPEPGAAFASVTYTTEIPGGAAQGGTGGNAVRIKGFRVTPGDTYIIRVGAGGEGGKAGVNGNNGNGPTKGENGGGGTSTAIYDENNNILLMVSGGIGGQGGNVSENGVDLPPFPYSRAVQSFMVTESGNGPDGYILPNGRFDDDMINVEETKVSNTNIDWSGNTPNGKVINLSYNYALEVPYCAFNGEPGTINDLDSGDCITRSTSLGAFFPYSRGVTDGNLIPAQLQNPYNGLYFRSIIGNYPAYLGGLGGMSGLGTKAGCGGLFVGNNGEHTKADNTDEDDTNVLNTMIINDTLYKVSDYYDNCTLSTPDGQSANFILPTVNGPTFGSAGAGGGGGAWSPVLGAGKGGRGQDGYLMIEWRR